MGLIVAIDPHHLSRQMRGVQKQHSITTTSDVTGVFPQATTREEFLNLIKG
jgi:GTP cyclohydrolase I